MNKQYCLSCRKYRLFSLLWLILFLSGCNSGSGSNATPVADAGPDQYVITGSVVTLDGSGSSDANGNTLTYRWSFVSKPAGSNATLSSSASVQPSFTVDLTGAYIVSLVVNNGTSSSTADNVTIVAVTNSRPVANAGADESINKNQIVTLDGSASSDADGDTLSYSWTLLSKPAGSAASLSFADTVNPMFLADKEGDYTVSLVVNDGLINSAADEVLITAVNTPPVANAGPDQYATTGQVVTLDGSGSYDDDHDTLSYSWSFDFIPSGSSASLTNPTDVAPSFTADMTGEYVVSLIVNDGSEDSEYKTVKITVIDKALPIRITHTVPGSIWPSLVYEYIYDNQRKLIQETTTQLIQGSVSSQTTTIYTYDANGHLIYTQDVGNPTGCAIQTDSYGNITLRSCAGGLSVDTYTYTYNSDGTKASEIETSTVTLEDGSTRTSSVTILYDYDADGRLIERTLLGGYGSDVYEYDSQGFLVRESHFDDAGVLWFYYLYVNDSYGNPLTKTYYDENDIVRSIIQYEY